MCMHVKWRPIQTWYYKPTWVSTNGQLKIQYAKDTLKTHLSDHILRCLRPRVHILLVLARFRPDFTICSKYKYKNESTQDILRMQLKPDSSDHIVRWSGPLLAPIFCCLKVKARLKDHLQKLHPLKQWEMCNPGAESSLFSPFPSFSRGVTCIPAILTSALTWRVAANHGSLSVVVDGTSGLSALSYRHLFSMLQVS